MTTAQPAIPMSPQPSSGPPSDSAIEREAHAWAAFAAVLFASAGAVAGFVLLP